MVNPEIHCVQLIIRYMHLVATLMVHKLLHAVVFHDAVCCVSLIVETCSDVFERSARMASITVVWGSMNLMCVYN
jgi:hypothetical protein